MIRGQGWNAMLHVGKWEEGWPGTRRITPPSGGHTTANRQLARARPTNPHEPEQPQTPLADITPSRPLQPAAACKSTLLTAYQRPTFEMHRFQAILFVLLAVSLMMARQWCGCAAHESCLGHAPPAIESVSSCAHACEHARPTRQPAPNAPAHLPVDHDCCCSAEPWPMVPSDGGIQFVRSFGSVPADLSGCGTRNPHGSAPARWERGLLVAQPPPTTPLRLGVLLTI